MSVTREDVKRIVEQRWGDGKPFQAKEVREELGIASTDREGVSKVHNLVKALERDGKIERLPGDQKRNQLFRVKDASSPAPTDAPTGRSSNNVPKPQTATNRLGRMEDTLLHLQQRLTVIETKLDRALAIWQ
jgi:hypothetical protein